MCVILDVDAAKRLGVGFHHELFSFISRLKQADRAVFNRPDTPSSGSSR
jgi:hypothetical protein